MQRGLLGVLSLIQIGSLLMAHFFRSTTALLLLVGFVLPIESRGQEKPSAFQICFAYVLEATELNNKFQQHWSDGIKLLEERRQALTRLVETKSTVNHLSFDEFLGTMALFEAQVAGMTLEAELNAALQNQLSFRPKQLIDVRHAPETQFGSFTRQLPGNPAHQAAATAMANMSVQVDAILHEMKSVRKAQRMAMERQISLVKELQTIFAELVAWHSKSVSLFDQYWEFSDVAGVRSDLELRTALRELEKAREDNLGATFARAVTLKRLGKYEAAEPLLTRLTAIPTVRPIALAARAELLARVGRKQDANKDLRATMPAGRDDPRVRMHRAQYFSAVGDLRRAESEWETVQKQGGHEIAARRAIALINASYPKLNGIHKRKAKEQALLASQLAGDDWACEVALALAAAAQGDTADGIEALQRAGELAIGENRILCDNLLQRLKSGARVSWNF